MPSFYLLNFRCSCSLFIRSINWKAVFVWCFTKNNLSVEFKHVVICLSVAKKQFSWIIFPTKSRTITQTMHFSRNKPSSRVNVTTARQPISAESITKSIRLSINNYQSNATRNKNNGRRIENGTLAIENMTTNDFADDFRAHFTYHEKLLHDIMFMHTYWTAIVGNAHLFKNQIIVDVRCGLGVLSIFAL